MRMALAAIVMGFALAQGVEKPTESAHVSGPKGLEGWTLSHTFEGLGAEQFPAELVIAQRGQVIRRFSGKPFMWTWMFARNKNRVAYIASPLHFGMHCFLADIKTGKQIADYECFADPRPAEEPEWVKDLENFARTPTNVVVHP